MSGIDDSELTEWELEALQKAEAKFMRQRGESNQFSVLPVAGEEEVRGTWFTAYDNSSADERVPEPYRAYAVLLYSEKNRFPYLCEQFMRTWSHTPDEFIETILQLESGQADLEADLAAKSFGVDVAEDCYIVTFQTTSTAPIFATRELLFKFVRFALAAQARVGVWRDRPEMQERLSDLMNDWEAVVAAKTPAKEKSSR